MPALLPAHHTSGVGSAGEASGRHAVNLLLSLALAPLNQPEPFQVEHGWRVHSRGRGHAPDFAD
jgi:hypothetical protein